VAGSCEHGNESSGSIKGGEFVDWLTLLHGISLFIRLMKETFPHSSRNYTLPCKHTNTSKVVPVLN
jgi:hypothetical protein